MKARRGENLAGRSCSADPELQPGKGEFEIVADQKTGQRWFWFRCPGPCGSTAPIALRPVAAPMVQQSWEFDGNEEAPTLQPSINHVGCWHGFLTAGEFRSC